MASREQVTVYLNNLRRQREGIDAKIAEAEVTLRVLSALDGSGTPKKPATPEELPLTDMILGLLKAVHPKGLSKSALRDAIKEKHRKTVNTNSLSVTLSNRLAKKQKKVKHYNGEWFYVP